MRARVAVTIPEDIREILEDGLRDADLRDVEAAHMTPREALEESVRRSLRPLTVLVDGRAAAIFGVAPHPQDGVGIVWLLGTDRLLQVRTQFLRESRRWLDYVGSPFNLLANVVHQDNHVHIHWLRWLGFTLMQQRIGQSIVFARVQPCVTPSA